MAGPRDAKSVFLRNNLMTVVDGRGHIWIYDPSIVKDAAGEDIVAPADFDRAYLGDNSIMAIDTSGNSWLYHLIEGTWSKGHNVDEMLEGEAEKIYEPWKRGNNVTVRVAEKEEEPPPEGIPTKRKSKSKEHEEA